MRGLATEAEELFAQVRGALDEHDLQRNGYFQIHLAFAEPLLGNGEVVEREQRATCTALEEVSEKTMYSSVAAMFARTLYARGRIDEAEHYTRASEAAAGPIDIHAQVVWRSTRAKVLAQRGELEAAEALAREAVAFAEQSDFLVTHADALMDMAEVLQLARLSDKAADAAARALALYEAKGNIVMAERTRAALAGI
jgi:tetratricopeptide (TPR) repeat protein